MVCVLHSKLPPSAPAFIASPPFPSLLRNVVHLSLINMYWMAGILRSIWTFRLRPSVVCAHNCLLDSMAIICWLEWTQRAEAETSAKAYRSRLDQAINISSHARASYPTICYATLVSLHLVCVSKQFLSQANGENLFCAHRLTLQNIIHVPKTKKYGLRMNFSFNHTSYLLFHVKGPKQSREGRRIRVAKKSRRRSEITLVLYVAQMMISLALLCNIRGKLSPQILGQMKDIQHFMFSHLLVMAKLRKMWTKSVPPQCVANLMQLHCLGSFPFERTSKHLQKHLASFIAVGFWKLRTK